MARAVAGACLELGVLYLVTGWTLTPAFAAAAMFLSSVSDVLNALRLSRPVRSSVSVLTVRSVALRASPGSFGRFPVETHVSPDCTVWYSSRCHIDPAGDRPVVPEVAPLRRAHG